MKISFEETALHSESPVQPDLHLSDAAATRIRHIFARKQRPEGTFLRVVVQGGGCNGFEYHFVFDHNRQKNDISVTNGTTEVVVDFNSYQLLQGSTIDFEESLQDSRFIIRNPNAKSSCGCGNSFSV